MIFNHKPTKADRAYEAKIQSEARKAHKALKGKTEVTGAFLMRTIRTICECPPKNGAMDIGDEMVDLGLIEFLEEKSLRKSYYKIKR